MASGEVKRIQNRHLRKIYKTAVSRDRKMFVTGTDD
jgi:hypothetical protein